MALALLMPLASPTLHAKPPQLADPSGTLVEVGSNNLGAILAGVNLYEKKCMLRDTEFCDKAADLARQGLVLNRPKQTSEADWQKAVYGAFPVLHSAIAQDDMFAKRDYKDAEVQYTEELKLMSDEESKTRGLNDCVWLATAYTEPGDAQDLLKAIWLYARADDFVPSTPPNYKAEIEARLVYVYKRYHGTLDGADAIKQQIDAVKAQAQNAIFPPDSFKVAPAPSLAEIIHAEVAQESPPSPRHRIDLETVLAMGYQEDADKAWARLKGQSTLVPGIVIAASSDQIQLAVTQDAKDAHVADFLVIMKSPLTETQLREIQPGFEFKASPNQSLTGTYDSYRRIPASGNRPASVEITMKDGAVVPAQANAWSAHRQAPHMAH
jgi:hypothetical protein